MTYVSSDLATAFASGDRLIVVQDTGDLLHVPVGVAQVAAAAVDAAVDAFGRMALVSDDQISEFYRRFGERLADDAAFRPIAEANRLDVDRAREAGRSVTRLVLSDEMRSDMVRGLELWADRSGGRGQVVDVVEHPGWRVELVRAGLGVVGFVFEGRPNVFADATGVLRSGNTVVFRIGSDALATARAIMTSALAPALSGAGLPEGAVSLVDSPSRAAGWAMFADGRLSLAVARGSGSAVSQLGAVARQAGVAVSLHGTGGAWMMTSQNTDAERLRATIAHSLDRKVCNTLNTLCLLKSESDRLVGSVLQGLAASARELGTNPKLHVTPDARYLVPDEWWHEVSIERAHGAQLEPQTEVIARSELGREWEWEQSPELTLCVVDSLDEATDLFNQQSPRFVASLSSSDAAEQDWFYARVDAPFVGTGFTRWVDGQYALDRPELGLSNWQYGRLFGRGGVLAGDSVFTIRTRMYQENPAQRR